MGITRRPIGIVVEAFITSLSLVAIAEIGDKTQLLSFMLAVRFKGQHWAIIAGIFAATIANHLFAAFIGDWVADKVSPDIIRWVLGITFLGFAVWALIPDSLEHRDESKSRYGVFLTTLALFFMAEMGDKTQLATVALAAKYAEVLMVTAGTTAGLMLANVPAVLLGEKLAQRIPLRTFRMIAAALFAVFGTLILFNVGIPT